MNKAFWIIRIAKNEQNQAEPKKILLRHGHRA